MARRLLLLFAALLATLALAPGQSVADTQDRVGAFLSAAPTCTSATAAESSCTHPGFKLESARIAAGCCVATKGAGSKLGRTLADERGGSSSIPGFPFRGPKAPERAYDNLARNHGVDRGVASDRLHKLKEGGGLGATDDVVIGRTGDVYDARTEDYLGSLTDKALGR